MNALRHLESVVTNTLTSFLPSDLIKLCIQFSIPQEVWDEAFKDACKKGDFKNVKYLRKRVLCTTDGLIGAACEGQLGVVKYLSRHSGDYAYALMCAAEWGHLDVVKYFVSSKGMSSTDAFCMASSFGRLEVVKYLETSASSDEIKEAFIEAAAMGHIEVLKYLSNHKYLSWQENLSWQEALDRREYAVHRALSLARLCDRPEVIKYLTHLLEETCRKIKLLHGGDPIKPGARSAPQSG